MVDIIIPIYNEGKSLEKNIKRANEVLINSDISPRFILVDDGSEDESFRVIEKLSAEISVKGVRLSRNFGKEAAVCAGMEEAKSDLCAIMDADMQHPPEELRNMIKMLEEDELDIVCGMKDKRGRERLLYRVCVKWFYSFLRVMSGLDMNNSSDFMVMRGFVVKAFNDMKEKKVFFRGMVEWLGFKKGYYMFKVANRCDGQTRYGGIKRIKLALLAVTSLTSAPLALTGVIGAIFFIAALILGVQTIYKKLAGLSLEGFTTVILLILIVGGAIMISLNIIGTYISRIYDEVKNRPRYIVSKKVDKGKQG